LWNKGYNKNQEHPKDNSSKTIGLTESGNGYKKLAIIAFEEFDTNFTASLGIKIDFIIKLAELLF
jgi:hypothetical protein